MYNFIKVVLFPLLIIYLMLVTGKPFYMKPEGLDLFNLWLWVGIPFGLGKMKVFILPRLKSCNTGTGIAILAINFIVAGLIGGAVAIFKILYAVFYTIRTVVYGIIKVTNLHKN